MSKALFINGISCALLSCLNLPVASASTVMSQEKSGLTQSMLNVSHQVTDATIKRLYQGRLGLAPDTLLNAQQITRQRVAFALSEIFAVSSQEQSLTKYDDGLAWYYDLLVKHSFGNYRDLLQDVTLSPAMGVHLSMQGSRKADLKNNTFPDENYAREVMRLFSIGLFQLDLSGQAILDAQGNKNLSYKQADVENLARVFTGWDLVENKRYGHGRSGRYDTFMELSPKQHDYTEKVIFGQTINAGMKGSEELSLSLDLLFNHPNVGPFISRQLIQGLASSNPSPDYVKRVAMVFNDNGAGSRGDLDAVVQAILLDEESQGATISPVFKS
ncbi:DUF1800 family protein [Moritella sp. 24]|uniref:DUF1800 family protein n=1 Tax=Moritella sp. 24 TaxID=2746230 RepID=UPI001BA86A68|nr:DUF1800 family protein [Moritella sp. 24]QUM77431.1 DUF1800 family protein [Moritella sp. 24]